MDAVHPVPIWMSNFENVKAILKCVAKRSVHVGFNVQYPGCVFHADGKRHYTSLTAEENYALVRANVNYLEPLQVGLAVRTDDGELYAWEFNIINNVDIMSEDYRCAPESIDYLFSRWLDFNRLSYDGVPGHELRRLLRDSGLIRACSPEWTTFTGAYHVAYLLKIMIVEDLPAELNEFMDLVRDGIGSRIFDVKVMAREYDPECSRGPLRVIAEKLVGATIMEEEAGKKDLAGAAAMLSLQAFVVLKDKMGDGRDKCRRMFCGIQTF